MAELFRGESSRRRHAPRYTGTTAANESLQIDLPSFHDDSALFGSTDDHIRAGGSDTTAYPPKVGRSLTARTISCDLDRPSGSKKRRPERSRSKYFTEDHNDFVDDHRDASPEAQSDAHYSDDSEPLMEFIVPPKRSRTNPFTTTREASEKKRSLPTSGQDHGRPRTLLETIDMISPDKPKPAPLASRRIVDGGGRVGRQRDVGDVLGLKDAQGRLKRGVASGVKVKRRA
jgi:hypothetical protein